MSNINCTFAQNTVFCCGVLLLFSYNNTGTSYYVVAIYSSQSLLLDLSKQCLVVVSLIPSDGRFHEHLLVFTYYLFS